MADSVKFAVSCTPLETPTIDQGAATDILASEVDKTLSGSGTASVTDYSGNGTTQGQVDGAPSYREAPDGAGNENTLSHTSGESSASFVFIKNTGFVFSSTSALGAVENDLFLKVTIGSDVTTALLDAGEAIILKAHQSTAGAVLDATGIKVGTQDNTGADASGGNHLAVEYLVVT